MRPTKKLIAVGKKAAGGGRTLGLCGCQSTLTAGGAVTSWGWSGWVGTRLILMLTGLGAQQGSGGGIQKVTELICPRQSGGVDPLKVRSGLNLSQLI